MCKASIRLINNHYHHHSFSQTARALFGHVLLKVSKVRVEKRKRKRRRDDSPGRLMLWKLGVDLPPDHMKILQTD